MSASIWDDPCASFSPWRGSAALDGGRAPAGRPDHATVLAPHSPPWKTRSMAEICFERRPQGYALDRARPSGCSPGGGDETPGRLAVSSEIGGADLAPLSGARGLCAHRRLSTARHVCFLAPRTADLAKQYPRPLSSRSFSRLPAACSRCRSARRDIAISLAPPNVKGQDRSARRLTDYSSAVFATQDYLDRSKPIEDARRTCRTIPVTAKHSDDPDLHPRARLSRRDPRRVLRAKIAFLFLLVTQIARRRSPPAVFGRVPCCPTTSPRPDPRLVQILARARPAFSRPTGHRPQPT